MKTLVVGYGSIGKRHVKNLMGFNQTQVSVCSKNKEVLRILGEEGYIGPMLGLGMKFGYNIIEQVGNYGESFERNVGEETPLALERGLNRLWKDGGILYVPPIR